MIFPSFKIAVLNIQPSKRVKHQINMTCKIRTVIGQASATKYDNDDQWY